VDVAAADVAEAEDREVAEAFLAVEAVFREEAAISRELKEVFREVAAVSPAVAILLIPAVCLAAAGAASPEAETVFHLAAAGVFPAAAIVVPVGAPGPLDITVLRTILRCSPISEDHY
jgi:hypothetical protein